VGGGVDRKEETIRTPGGHKSRRRADITFRNRRTGEIYREQIGLEDAQGRPITREGEALDDIEGATGKRPQFTPYHPPKKPGKADEPRSSSETGAQSSSE
jgi:hypothetical protein